MKEFSYGICPYQVREDGVYVLLNKTGRVGDYNFFKGKIESGETIRDCAVREFEEESGIVVSKSYLGDYFFQKGTRKDVGVFLISFTDKDISISADPEEIFSYSWVRIDNGVVTSKNQQKIMNDIIHYFSKRTKNIKI